MSKRNVKGLLFADYVRMIRSQKHVDWAAHVAREDMFYLRTPIEPLEWYPMETFERLGNAILKVVADGNIDAVRMWGRVSTDQLRSAMPNLVADGNPVETMMRFRVQRATYFDFEALEIPMLVDGHAHVVIHYFMGAVAEEAASHQTLGFFERLLELSGATAIHPVLREKSWGGDPRTLLELTWEQPDWGQPAL